MASFRLQFENELRLKIQQKATAHVSEETVLLRAFKYFDLDNSGNVSLEEWLKAIEKTGVVVENREQLEQLFHYYDLDHSGELDYKEFVAAIFGDQTPAQMQNAQSAQAVLARIRDKLAARGARGIIGLARVFKIMDDDNSHELDFPEFRKAVRDFRLEIPEEDVRTVFNAIDRNRSGAIDYDEFLRAIRGPMNDFRRNLVARAFAKLDADGSGILELSDIKKFYNAKGHPDVKAGRKQEEDVLGEFLDTFEMHHNINSEGDRRVNLEEFEEYYNNVSMSVDDDPYFELMMTNTWKLTEAPAYTRNKAWTNKQDTQAFGGNPRESSGKRGGQGSEVINVHHKSSVGELIGTRTQAVPPPTPPPSAPLRGENVEVLLDKFRSRLLGRGTRGIIGISRQFKIMDDDNSGQLSFEEFKKGCRDFRLELTDQDISLIYRAFDRDRSGQIDYDELLRGIRGPMNSFRRGLVAQAWKKLDRDGSGVLDINDIKGVYDPSRHPDVRSGKKTQDEVLNEFLETFEMHHNISDRSLMDHRVTREEFEEYYNNVSASVDDDQYFELMMNNAWQLKGGTRKGGRAGYWAADNHRSQYGGTVASNAPYGTFDTPQDWTTTKAEGAQGDLLQMADSIPIAGAPTPGRSGAQGEVAQIRQADQLVAVFREKLLARGTRGILGLGRIFRIIDDNRSETLDATEFAKALRDFRMDMSEAEARILFNRFDASKDGQIDYNEFLRTVRGEMGPARKMLVQRVFSKLDRNSNGIVEIDDIKGVYNAKQHPEVRMGRKTEEEVLGEFLDTFEMHHSLFVGGQQRDRRVSPEEFEEYYNNISASIDDDQYFELMVKNAWNLEGKSYQKGWAADSTTPARKVKYF